jgi:hypothetical protein
MNSLIQESVASAKKRFVDSKRMTLEEFRGMLNWALPMDPSSTKKYIEQIVLFYTQFTAEMTSKGVTESSYEWSERMADAIRIYDNYLERGAPLEPKEKNIQNFKTLKQLQVVVDKYRTWKSESEKKKQHAVAGDSYKGWKILPITSEEQSCKYGAGTKWCIAATKAKNWFNKYRYESFISFYFLFKDKKKYALALNPNGKAYKIYDENDKKIEDGSDWKWSTWLRFEVENDRYLPAVYPFKPIPFTKEEKEEIALEPADSLKFAREVMKGRFPEAEDNISKRPSISYKYATKIIKGRWPKGEKSILRSTEYIFCYARDVIKNRWPAAEKVMLLTLEREPLTRYYSPPSNILWISEYIEHFNLTYDKKYQKFTEKTNEEFTRLSRKEVLNELTAEELAQNKGSDSPNIDNKGGIVQQSVGMMSWNRRNNIITLRSKSVSRGFNHRVRILFDDMTELKEKIASKEVDTSTPPKLRALLQQVVRGDVRLHCECESYQYYRSYQLTQLDSAIVPEPRPPKRNDPDLERSHLCHHLLAGLRYLMKFEQHIMTFMIKRDDQLRPKNWLKGPTRAGGMEKIVASQLGNLIDQWAASIGKALADETIAKELAVGIKKILNKKMIRTENVLNEAEFESAVDRLQVQVDEFIEYITDNFVPRGDRDIVKRELLRFINSVLSGIEEPESELEPEPEIEEDIPIEKEEDDYAMITNEKIRGIVQNILKEEIDPDEVNGADPSEKNPAEMMLSQAIKEYANQVGKQMYVNDFESIIMGIVKSFDSTDKLANLRKFVGSTENIQQPLAEPLDAPSPEPELDEFGGGDDLFGNEEYEEEPTADDSELNAVDGMEEENPEEKMAEKKKDLEL